MLIISGRYCYIILTKVELIISTRFNELQCSEAPLPVFPKNPVAWHSSTITTAPYSSAKSHIYNKNRIGQNPSRKEKENGNENENEMSKCCLLCSMGIGRCIVGWL